MRNSKPSATGVAVRSINIFLPSLAGGGAERVGVNLARGLNEQGCAVSLLVGSAEGPLVGLVPPGVPIINLAKKRVLSCIIPLARHIRANNPSAIISHMDYANMAVLMASALAGRGTRVLAVEHIPPHYSPFPLKRLLGRLFYPGAHKIVAVSSGLAAALEDYWRGVGCDIEVIYNPIVSDLIRSKAREHVTHPWLSKRSEIPVFVAAGRLEVQKGFSILLNAFALFSKKRAARLIILGDGILRKELEQQTETLKIADRVSFAGFQENPYSYFANADCFVLSSLFEALPTALVEALACGCPCVATNCPTGPAEILNNGSFGVLVNPGDPDALAEAMHKALRTAFDKALLIKRGLDFSVGQSVNRYLRLLHE